MVSVPSGPRARSEADGGSPVAISRDGGTVLLVPAGQLDEAGAAHLLAAVDEALDSDVTRIDIDLCTIEGFTPDGAACLVACRARCAGLADGLHFRTSRGPGRHAVLMAFAETD